MNPFRTWALITSSTRFPGSRAIKAPIANWAVNKP